MVIVDKFPKRVPKGKKWILKADSQIKIRVSSGVSQSGTFCNASFFSNPHIVGTIYRGDPQSSIGYGIFFRNLEKMFFDNDNTYSISPISFFDKTFNLIQLEYTKPENVGSSTLEFNEGETVFVGNCIEAIEVIELESREEKLLSEYPTSMGRAKGEDSISIGCEIVDRIDNIIRTKTTRTLIEKMYWAPGLNHIKIVNTDDSKITLQSTLNTNVKYVCNFDSNEYCEEIIKEISIDKAPDTLLKKIKENLSYNGFVYDEKKDKYFNSRRNLMLGIKALQLSNKNGVIMISKRRIN